MLLFLFLQFLVNIIFVQSLNIPEYEWKYINDNPHLIDKNIPFIIRNGPSKRWPLSNQKKILKNVAHIFSDYGNSSYQFQTSNCACFGYETDTCMDYINKHTYMSSNKQEQYGRREESFWYPYEVSYNKLEQYNTCVHKEKQWDSTVKIIKRINRYNKQSDINNNISSLAFAFKIMEQDTKTKQLYMDDLSYKCLELISLDPYFNLLKLNNKLRDLTAIHLWFGTNNYRTRLHFDFEENLFFVLNGFKTFLISPPSLNTFNLFPFIHESSRQTSHIQSNISNDPNIHAVTMESGDALWLPSFWYHEVINGNSATMSYALNLWIYNREIPVNQMVADIEHYKFPKDIMRIFKKGFKEKQFYEMIYFLHELEIEFCDRISDDVSQCNDNGLMMSYFGSIYPILYDIQRYHLYIGNDIRINSNWEWLDWFADFRSIFGGDTVSNKMEKLFDERERTLYCRYGSDKFDDVIDDIMDLVLELKEGKGENVAQITLAMLIENICFIATQDTQVMPLIAALYFL